MSQSVIVVPCYNESDRLDVRRFVGFARSHDAFKLLFVNDGSTDDTSDCLHRMQREAAESIVVRDMPKNCGKAIPFMRSSSRSSISSTARWWLLKCSRAPTSVTGAAS